MNTKSSPTPSVKLFRRLCIAAVLIIVLYVAGRIIYNTGVMSENRKQVEQNFNSNH